MREVFKDGQDQLAPRTLTDRDVTPFAGREGTTLGDPLRYTAALPREVSGRRTAATEGTMEATAGGKEQGASPVRRGPSGPPPDPLPAPECSPQTTVVDPAPTALQQFWDERPNLDTEVAAILSAPGLLTDEQLIDLHAILSHYLPEAGGYDATFDFSREIGAQISAVKAMRSKVLGNHGQLREGVSTREAKEVLGASTTLLTTLMKHHEKILNFERQRALEMAVKAAVQTLEPEAQKRFFDELEERLRELEK